MLKANFGTFISPVEKTLGEFWEISERTAPDCSISQELEEKSEEEEEEKRKKSAKWEEEKERNESEAKKGSRQ